jgi:hypothetical protein
MSMRVALDTGATQYKPNCHYCGEPGHYTNRCPEEKREQPWYTTKDKGKKDKGKGNGRDGQGGKNGKGGQGGTGGGKRWP